MSGGVLSEPSLLISEVNVNTSPVRVDFSVSLTVIVSSLASASWARAWRSEIVHRADDQGGGHHQDKEDA